MIRIALLVGATCALLFTLGVGLIRALPRDDSDVRAFLFGGCESLLDDLPCWQGIVPGETSIGEAISILQAHPWITDVTIRTETLFGYVTWRWNGQQPAFVGNPAARQPPNLWEQNGVIATIVIPTTLTYGDTVLLLGQPSLGTFQSFRPRSTPVTLGSSRHPNSFHVGAYDDGRMTFRTDFYCPSGPRGFWMADSVMTLFSTQASAGVIFRPYTLSDWLYFPPCDEPR